MILPYIMQYVVFFFNIKNLHFTFVLNINPTSIHPSGEREKNENYSTSFVSHQQKDEKK